MRLRDDLNVLAQAAPLPPEPDLLLRRARAIRQRRAVLVPAVAVVALLVLTVTYLSRVDGSGPTMTLTFRLEPPPDGLVVTASPGTGGQLDRVRDIVQARAKVAGLEHARARVEGDRVLLEFDATSARVDLQQLAAPGRLDLRKVLEATQGHGGVLPPDRPQGPEASTLDEVIAKIGPETWAQVSKLDAVSGELYRGFAGLTAREVRLLPARVQFYVVTVGCDQLRYDPAEPAPDAGVEVTACLVDEKLLLDGAAMSGADVADAMPEEVKQPEGGPEYWVRLKLTQAGQARWTDLTTRVARKDGCVPEPASWNCQLAFVIDGQVFSAPAIHRGMRANEAVITGLYTEEQARMVAARLGPRELPPGVKLDR